MKENEITMPKLSPTMEEATLVAWNKEINDDVKKGEVLFEVETDKVICEIEATADGKLKEMYFNEGDKVSVGQIVASIV